MSGSEQPVYLPTTQQHSDKTAQPEPDQLVHDSSLSIYQRLRHFLYINFVLNKRSFILSILRYCAEILLFVALNLYLVANKSFTYERACLSTPLNGSRLSRIRRDFSNDSTKTFSPNSTSNTQKEIQSIVTSTLSLNNSTNVSTGLDQERTSINVIQLKDSYMTLQILSILVFFVCFILSYLIKLQFKYHRLALNLYDYDVDTLNSSAADDGRNSLASTTTASHLSSRRKLSSLLKRLLVKCITKFAAVLLKLFYGYQFAQNVFIQQTDSYSDSPFTIFIHLFICICVLFRCGIVFMSKKNSLNKLEHLRKLEQKQKDLFDPTNAKNQHRYYYLYYYSYLIKSHSQNANQLKQHQHSQSTFRVFTLDEMALFIGFCAALFQLFSVAEAIQLLFLFAPLFISIILLRYKSILNAAVNVTLVLFSILLVSSRQLQNQQNSIIFNTDQLNMCNGNIGLMKAQSSFNLLSLNLLTFMCFLLTFYLKSMLSIYYCSLTSLERWNLAFLSQPDFWRRLSIYVSFGFYTLFLVSCTTALCFYYAHWAILVVPCFLCLACVWLAFGLMNCVNLTYLMAKVSSCRKELAEPKSGAASQTNLSGLTNSRQKHSHQINDSNSNNIRISQSSNINQGSTCSLVRFRQMLRRFLNQILYPNTIESQVQQIPIHRILADKDVRHLASISYRLGLYSFVQTIILSAFAFNSRSTFTIGVYLCSLSLNFIWTSLLYQFCKTITGTCIAYALVAPPHLLNPNAKHKITSLDSGGNYTTTSSLLSSNNPTLYPSNKLNQQQIFNSRDGNYPTLPNINSLSTTTTSNTYYNSTISGTGSSPMTLPFNLQAAISSRCTSILRQLQHFLYFHQIENFGCDFAATGLLKDKYIYRLTEFFMRRKPTDEPYDTYLLYYCGPTTQQTDNLSFIDGAELGIDEIVALWKETNLKKQNEQHSKSSAVKASPVQTDTDSKNEETYDEPSVIETPDVVVTQSINLKTALQTRPTSRLIIMLDSEHTAKSLDYVHSKLVEANVYVALQSCKYNYTIKTSKIGGKDGRVLTENGIGSVGIMGPGSPQVNLNTYPSGEDYLNFGKFTLDWLKSNYYNNQNFNSDQLNVDEYSDSFYSGQTKPFDEEREHLRLDSEEEDEDNEESQDELDMEIREAENQSSVRGRTAPACKSTERVFYEAKCAFSRYWIDFALQEQTLSHDFDQFWRVYYPYSSCKPLLKLVNCRIFYWKFHLLKRFFFYLRRVKTKLVPIHEYETGHGFKLFSS